ncbi:hypothetical protein LTR05_007221 [Lithohypha guttulata]|uniref:Uncharacterized protein n=1 Tax=Lithohypha guttulata TaxID=1690604 RepID=A0AAN7SUP3_9EURO|nr:hypothetical protein LTR05_007221 [Lithohypha guttulata]
MAAANDQSGFLRVFSARPQQVFKEPRINELSETAVQGMANGHRVYVFVANDNHLAAPDMVSSTQSSLMAMAVVSPVINLSLRMHNRKYNTVINNVVLPPGNMRAYKEFLLWVGDVVSKGSMVPLRNLKNKPITTYAEIVKIATKLKIGYLAVGLRRRVSSAVNPSVGKQFIVHPGDVRDLFTELPAGHWVRVAVAKGIAVAVNSNNLHPNFASKLDDLYSEIEGLDMEIQQEINELN